MTRGPRGHTTAQRNPGKPVSSFAICSATFEFKFKIRDNFAIDISNCSQAYLIIFFIISIIIVSTILTIIMLRGLHIIIELRVCANIFYAD